jgi:uncharacterized protein GlcG (DUF336 family)
MKLWICCACGLAMMAMTAGFAADSPPAAPEPVIISPDLITRADATQLVNAALDACEARGERVSALVMDAKGYLRAELSDDNAKSIGLTTSGQKAAAVLAFQVSSGALAARLKSDPQFAAQYGKDPRYHLTPGAFPIYRDGKFVALLAVGGGHAIDADCAQAALKTLPWASVEPGTSQATNTK